MGTAGKYMCDQLQKLGVEVSYFSDSNPDLWNTQYEGITCLPPEKLCGIDELSVIVESKYYHEIKERLLALGIININRFFLEKIEREHYLLRNKQEVEQKVNDVLAICEDKKSKNVYNHIIESWYAEDINEDWFEKICSEDQYFDSDIIQLKDNEVFVDAGAYIGDTAAEFLKACKGRFEKLYLFELDPEIYVSLKNNMKEMLPDGKYECYPYGVSNKDDIVSISCGDRNSAILAGNGKHEKQNEVLCKKLDDVLKNKRITFIKMDVEGAELQALEGAQTIIKEQKPTLAICIYHSANDFVNIPLYIKSLVPEYKIFIRHYTTEMYETVCYAICAGRK